MYQSPFPTFVAPNSYDKQSIVKQKRKALVDFELGKFSKLGINKNDLISLFDELSIKEKYESHLKIFHDKKTLNFLTIGGFDAIRDFYQTSFNTIQTNELSAFFEERLIKEYKQYCNSLKYDGLRYANLITSSLDILSQERIFAKVSQDILHVFNTDLGTYFDRVLMIDVTEAKFTHRKTFSKPVVNFVASLPTPFVEFKFEYEGYLKVMESMIVHNHPEKYLPSYHKLKLLEIKYELSTSASERELLKNEINTLKRTAIKPRASKESSSSSSDGNGAYVALRVIGFIIIMIRLMVTCS